MIYDNAIADSANVGTMKNNPHSAGVTFRPSAVERATDSFPVVGARRLLPQEAQ
jgi:hypothetical protein